MTLRRVVKSVMLEQGISQVKLARRLGISTQALWARLNGHGKDMTLSVAVETLAAVDYKLVAEPTESRLKDGAYAITHCSQDEED